MNFKAMAGLILLSITLGMTAQAESVEIFDDPSLCTEVRLDSVGAPFNKIPIYNQKLGSDHDANICYAITASELIDADHFNKHKFREELTSPLSIALLTRYYYELTKTESERQVMVNYSDPFTYMIAGGEVSDAIRISHRSSLCDQRSLESKASLIDMNSSSSSIESFLSEFFNFGAQGKLSSNIILNALSKVNKNCTLIRSTSDFTSPLELKMPDYLTELKSILNRTEAVSSVEKSRILKEFSEKYSAEAKSKFFYPQIIKLLNDKIPVGIGYIYNVTRLADPVYSSTLHASVIIGRKFNEQSKKCDFLVRDSYGPSCTDLKGEPRYRVPCENGNFWISGQELIRNLKTLTWIP